METPLFRKIFLFFNKRFWRYGKVVFRPDCFLNPKLQWKHFLRITWVTWSTARLCHWCKPQRKPQEVVGGWRRSMLFSDLSRELCFLVNGNIIIAKLFCWGFFVVREYWKSFAHICNDNAATDLRSPYTSMTKTSSINHLNCKQSRTYFITFTFYS